MLTDPLMRTLLAEFNLVNYLTSLPLVGGGPLGSGSAVAVQLKPSPSLPARGRRLFITITPSTRFVSSAQVASAVRSLRQRTRCSSASKSRNSDPQEGRQASSAGQSITPGQVRVEMPPPEAACSQFNRSASAQVNPPSSPLRSPRRHPQDPVPPQHTTPPLTSPAITREPTLQTTQSKVAGPLQLFQSIFAPRGDETQVPRRKWVSGRAGLLQMMLEKGQ
ncbi:hypothetical protein QBC39DRAFT_158716 [Podospora conica]|nr:hypothetical protein QBC39DRAFT_158716 [Schizothecium conicum]